MKATARPSPSAITQALVPYPPRDRPSASRVSRSADEPPFERHRLLSGGPGCWCRPETSSRAGHHAPGRGAAAAPTRPGAPSGGRSAPPATRDQAQPGWRATWPRSDDARRWPTACAAGPEAGSCPWAGIPRSAAPASSSVRLSAWPLLPSQEEQNARKPIQFKREQALALQLRSPSGLERTCEEPHLVTRLTPYPGSKGSKAGRSAGQNSLKIPAPPRLQL